MLYSDITLRKKVTPVPLLYICNNLRSWMQCNWHPEVWYLGCRLGVRGKKIMWCSPKPEKGPRHRCIGLAQLVLPILIHVPSGLHHGDGATQGRQWLEIWQSHWLNVKSAFDTVNYQMTRVELQNSITMSWHVHHQCITPFLNQVPMTKISTWSSRQLFSRSLLAC